MNNYVKLWLFFVGLLNTIPTFSMKEIIVKDLQNGIDQLDCKLLNKEKCSINYLNKRSMRINMHNDSYDVVMNDDYTIELRSKQPVTLCEKCIILQGHQGKIIATSFSDNGKYFVSGSADCTVRIWEVESGDCLIVLGPYNALAAYPEIGLFVDFMSNEKIRIASPRNDLSIKKIIHVLGKYVVNILSVGIIKSYTPDYFYNESILTLKKHDDFIKKTKDDWSSDVKFYDMKFEYR